MEMVRAARKSGKHHVSTLPQGATHELCGWGGVAISGKGEWKLRGCLRTSRASLRPDVEMIVSGLSRNF